MSQTPIGVGNIGERERRKRALIGTVSFALGALGYAVLVVLGVERIWRLLLFLPIWFAFLAWLETRGAT